MFSFWIRQGSGLWFSHDHQEAKPKKESSAASCRVIYMQDRSFKYEDLVCSVHTRYDKKLHITLFRRKSLKRIKRSPHRSGFNDSKSEATTRYHPMGIPSPSSGLSALGVDIRVLQPTTEQSPLPIQMMPFQSLQSTPHFSRSPPD